MATDIGVGDSETPVLVVQPADGTTTVTLRVYPATGDPFDIAMTGGPLVDIPDTDPVEQQQTWTGEPVTYTVAGRWVLSYTTTGTGEGAEEYEAYVVESPVAGGPTWLPGRSRVANYVPGRTLTVDANTHELTFSSTTRPTGLMVDRLIADAATRITSTVGTLAATLEAQAAVLTSMWTAAAVERGFPDDQQNQLSLQRADALEKRADLMLAELITANESLTGTGPDYALDIVPMWAFPPSDPRYDSNCYW